MIACKPNNETYKTKVINAEGNRILTDYEMVEALENTDGKTVWYEENVLRYMENGKYGLIDFSGKEIVEPIYDDIYAIEGIEKSLILEKDGKKGVINSKTKEIVVPVEYLEVTNISKSYEEKIYFYWKLIIKIQIIQRIGSVYRSVKV